MSLVLLLTLGACHSGVVLSGGSSSDKGNDPWNNDSTSTSDTATDDSGIEVIGDSGDSGDAPVDEPDPDVVVDCAGGADFTTITAAINAVPSGTNIGLKPCTYEEDVNFIGKSVNIYGMEGQSKTIVDGTGRGPVLIAARGESLGTRLAHVTLTGGSGNYGSGVYTDSAVLTLEHVLITKQTRTYAVIYGSGMSLTLIDVTIEDNAISRGGMVMYVDNGSILAQGLSMTCGDADYGIYEHAAVLVMDSEIACADGSYGVYVSGGEFHLRRSSIVAGSVGVYAEDNFDTLNERLWVTNSAVVGGDTSVSAKYMHFKARNDVLIGGRNGLILNHCHADSYLYSSYFEGSSCDVKGDNTAYPAGWNALSRGDACNIDSPDSVSGDPMFVNAPDDFTLVAGSPLIDAGDPEPDENDDDDSRNDIGIDGGPEGDGQR